MSKTAAISRSILVVEDSDSAAEPLLRLLQHAGHRPNWAHNGRDALEKLPHLETDLIILDILMPEMDGYQFLEQMRRDPRFQKLPVIVLTALQLGLDRQRLERLGVDEVLIKGAVDYHRLLHRLGAGGPPS